MPSHCSIPSKKTAKTDEELWAEFQAILDNSRPGAAVVGTKAFAYAQLASTANTWRALVFAPLPYEKEAGQYVYGGACMKFKDKASPGQDIIQELGCDPSTGAPSDFCASTNMNAWAAKGINKDERYGCCPAGDKVTDPSEVDGCLGAGGFTVNDESWLYTPYQNGVYTPASSGVPDYPAYNASNYFTSKAWLDANGDASFDYPCAWTNPDGCKDQGTECAVFAASNLAGQKTASSDEAAPYLGWGCILRATYGGPDSTASPGSPATTPYKRAYARHRLWTQLMEWLASSNYDTLDASIGIKIPLSSLYIKRLKQQHGVPFAVSGVDPTNDYVIITLCKGHGWGQGSSDNHDLGLFAIPNVQEQGSMEPVREEVAAPYFGGNRIGTDNSALSQWMLNLQVGARSFGLKVDKVSASVAPSTGPATHGGLPCVSHKDGPASGDNNGMPYGICLTGKTENGTEVGEAEGTAGASVVSLDPFTYELVSGDAAYPWQFMRINGFKEALGDAKLVVLQQRVGGIGYPLTPGTGVEETNVPWPSTQPLPPDTDVCCYGIYDQCIPPRDGIVFPVGKGICNTDWETECVENDGQCGGRYAYPAGKYVNTTKWTVNAAVAPNTPVVFSGETGMANLSRADVSQTADVDIEKDGSATQWTGMVEGDGYSVLYVFMLQGTPRTPGGLDYPNLEVVAYSVGAGDLVWMGTSLFRAEWDAPPYPSGEYVNITKWTVNAAVEPDTPVLFSGSGVANLSRADVSQTADVDIEEDGSATQWTGMVEGDGYSVLYVFMLQGTPRTPGGLDYPNLEVVAYSVGAGDPVWMGTSLFRAEWNAPPYPNGEYVNITEWIVNAAVEPDTPVVFSGSGVANLIRADISQTADVDIEEDGSATQWTGSVEGDGYSVLYVFMLQGTPRTPGGLDYPNLEVVAYSVGVGDPVWMGTSLFRAEWNAPAYPSGKYESIDGAENGLGITSADFDSGAKQVTLANTKCFREGTVDIRSSTSAERWVADISPDWYPGSDSAHYVFEFSDPTRSGDQLLVISGSKTVDGSETFVGTTSLTLVADTDFPAGPYRTIAQVENSVEIASSVTDYGDTLTFDGNGRVDFTGNIHLGEQVFSFALTRCNGAFEWAPACSWHGEAIVAKYTTPEEGDFVVTFAFTFLAGSGPDSYLVVDTHHTRTGSFLGKSTFRLASETPFLHPVGSYTEVPGHLSGLGVTGAVFSDNTDAVLHKGMESTSSALLETIDANTWVADAAGLEVDYKGASYVLEFAEPVGSEPPDALLITGTGYAYNSQVAVELGTSLLEPGEPSTECVENPWDQCGGIGWTGPTECCVGMECVFANPNWSACQVKEGYHVMPNGTVMKDSDHPK